MKQINLIPAEYAASRYIRKRVVTWIAFVLAVTAMMASIGLNLNAKTSKAEREKRQNAAQVKAINGINAQLQSVAAERAALCEKLKAVYDVQRKRTNVAILSEISRACTDKVFLMSLVLGAEAAAASVEQKPPAMPGPAKLPAPAPVELVKITLNGYALTNTDLTQFASALAASKLLKQVSLKFWRQESIRELKLIGFEIECFPELGGKPPVAAKL